MYVLTRKKLALVRDLADAMSTQIDVDIEHRAWILLRSSLQKRKQGHLESVELYTFRARPRRTQITWSVIHEITAKGASLNSSGLQTPSVPILRKLVRRARRQNRLGVRRLLAHRVKSNARAAVLPALPATYGNLSRA